MNCQPSALYPTIRGVFFSVLTLLAIASFPLSIRLAHAQTTAAAPNAQLTSSDAPVPVPAPSEKALRYHHGNNYIWAGYTLADLLVPAFYLLTGLSARVRTLAQKIGRRWFFTIAIYAVLSLLLLYLIRLPFGYYFGFVRQHAYGLSNQTFAKWMKDTAIMSGGELLTGVALLWIPYLLIKKSPKRWWLYTALVAIPLTFCMTVLWPVYVDPLFNDFGRMKDTKLEADILSLAERAGIEGSNVYEVNKSEDTNAVNAYVTGLGPTKRIVLWDTAINKLSHDELLCVMAHEMGHYVLGHIMQGVALSCATLLVSLYLVYKIATGLTARFGRYFGFDTLADVASAPLLAVTISALNLFIEPAGLAFSRHIEHESDRFSAEVTRNNHAASTAFVKLQQENLGVPRHGFWYTLLRASHPSIGDRIDFFNEYKPWKTGQPLRYEHLFKQSVAPAAPS